MTMVSLSLTKKRSQWICLYRGTSFNCPLATHR